MQVTGETRLKDWYHEHYEDDPIWEDMDDDATFIGLFHALDRHEDVYDYVGGDADSVVRERLFHQLADMLGCDYDVVYYQWLDVEPPTTPQVGDGLSVGDIWYSMWGYDQTNVDWYEVTKVTKCMVTLTPIASDKTETGFMQGTCTPKPGSYTGKPIRRKFNKYGEQMLVSVNSYANAYPWDGQPKHYSCYA